MDAPRQELFVRSFKFVAVLLVSRKIDFLCVRTERQIKLYHPTQMIGYSTCPKTLLVNISVFLEVCHHKRDITTVKRSQWILSGSGGMCVVPKALILPIRPHVGKYHK